MAFCKLFVWVVNLVVVFGSPTWLGIENVTTPGTDLDNISQTISEQPRSQLADITTQTDKHMDITIGKESIEGTTAGNTVRVIEGSQWQFRLPRLFCNFDADSEFREGPAQFRIDEIDASFCTDLNYDHAELQQYHFQSVTRTDVFPHERNLFLPSYIAINDLKVSNPSLRTFLTLTESSVITFGSIVTNSDLTRDFVTSCGYNLRLWGFNGLILKWVYPPQPEYLTQMLEDLRNAFLLDFKKQKKGQQRLLLGVILTGETGVASEWYEVYAVSKLVDIIVLQMFDSEPLVLPNATSILTYLYRPSNDNTVPQVDTNNSKDFNASEIIEANLDLHASEQKLHTHTMDSYSHHPNAVSHGEPRRRVGPKESRASEVDGSWEEFVSLVAESLSTPRLFFLDDTINEWTGLGADKSKLVIGLSLIGQAFLLQDKSLTGIGAPVHAESRQIFFYETCNISKQGTLMRVSAEDKSPFWFNDTVWMTYDDMASLAQKVAYVRDNHLGGLMLFSLSEDDFSGAHCGLGPFPILRMVHNVSRVYLSPLADFGRHEWEQYCGDASSVPHIAIWRLVLLVYVKYLI